MKKIAILTQQYKNIRSGVGFYSRTLIKKLRKRGYEVTVLCPEKEEIEEDDNQILLKCPTWDPTPGKWFSLSYKFAKKIKKSGFIKNCDIIHFTDAREALFLKDFDGKTVGTVHDNYNLRMPENPFSLRKYYKDWMIRWIYGRILYFLEKKTYPTLDMIITNSDFVREDLIDIPKLDENKVEKIYYGLPSQKERNGTTGKNSKRLLFVGGNFQRKGLPDLLNIMDKLKEKFSDIKLDVVGSNRSISWMKKLAEKKELSSHVDFHGELDNESLEAFYRKATLFVMPSVIEAFGIAYLEAMSYGMPVIGTEKGGTRELIRNGKDGFLISPGDQKQLLTKIDELLSCDKKRELFSKNARRRSANFKLSEMVDKTIEIYRALQ